MLRVNVRTLVEFALEGGDISPGMMAAERMQEGMRGHQQLQREYPEGYRAEVPLSLEVPFFEEETLTLHGRIDGLFWDGGIPTIEEIKTTNQDISRFTEGYRVHWAQAEVYAHMLAAAEGLPLVHVQLTYFNIHSQQRTTLKRSRTKAQLAQIFGELYEPYASWLRQVLSYADRRRASLKALRFPYPTYREGQRQMARQAYIALRDKSSILIEAPTGTGKSAASLFPALKAMGEGLVNAIFYLTARGTARQAALGAYDAMAGQGMYARVVVITAKEKVCKNPEAGCDPALCPYASGYYDRRRAALYEALGVLRFDEEQIDALSEKHTLCPFELSLDLAEIADVVVCDYNYVFDPYVKLKRFFQDKGNYALLIDEAHHLCDRAREMLSARVEMASFAKLRRQLRAGGQTGHPLYDPLTRVLKAFRQIEKGRAEEGDVYEDYPESLLIAIQNFSEIAYDFLSMPPVTDGSLTDVYFEALTFVRVADGYDGRYKTLLEGTGRGIAVRLFCMDPSEYLQKCMKKVRGSVLFSATLTPMPYYGNLLGLSEDKGDAFLRLSSPFPEERLLVMKKGVPTRYRQRQESLGQVVKSILAMARAKKGNYIACFPSHAYLNQVLSQLGGYGENIRVLAQRPGMDARERQAFLDAFSENPQRSMVGLITMGGIFSESVDLPGDRLSGAVIVGVGLPQVCAECEVLRQYYEERYESGYAYAYIYPGMVKVMQAAGRVIRSEQDVGAVLLLDDRYFGPPYPELMPEHWHVRQVRDDAQLQKWLAWFWGRYGGKEEKENEPN